MIKPIHHPFVLPKWRGNEFADDFRSDLVGSEPRGWSMLVGGFTVEPYGLLIPLQPVNDLAAYIPHPPTENCDIECEYVLQSANGVSRTECLLAWVQNATNYYAGGAGGYGYYVNLQENVAGTAVDLGGVSGSFPRNTPVYIRFRKDGAMLTATVGSQTVSVSDTSLTGKGYIGLLTPNNQTTLTGYIPWIRAKVW